MSNVNWAASDHLPWRTAEWLIGGSTERATRVRGQKPSACRGAVAQYVGMSLRREHTPLGPLSYGSKEATHLWSRMP